MEAPIAYNNPNNNPRQNYQNPSFHNNGYSNYDYGNSWNNAVPMSPGYASQQQQNYQKNHFQGQLSMQSAYDHNNYMQSTLPQGGYYQAPNQQMAAAPSNDYNNYGGYASRMANNGYMTNGGANYASPRASPQAMPRRNRNGVGRSMSINRGGASRNPRNRRSPRHKRGRTRGRNNGNTRKAAQNPMNRSMARYQPNNHHQMGAGQRRSPTPRNNRRGQMQGMAGGAVNGGNNLTLQGGQLSNYVSGNYHQVHSNMHTPQRQRMQASQIGNVNNQMMPLAGNQSPSNRQRYDSPSPSKIRNNNYQSSPGGWMSPYFPNRGTTPYYGKIDPYSSNQGSGSYEPEEQIEYEINDEFLYQNIGGRRRNNKIRSSQMENNFAAASTFLENRRPTRTHGTMEKPIMRMSTKQLNNVTPNKTYHFSHELSELGTQYLQVLMSLKNSGTAFEDTDFPPDIRSIIGTSQTAYQDM